MVNLPSNFGDWRKIPGPLDRFVQYRTEQADAETKAAQNAQALQLGQMKLEDGRNALADYQRAKVTRDLVSRVQAGDAAAAQELAQVDPAALAGLHEQHQKTMKAVAPRLIPAVKQMKAMLQQGATPAQVQQWAMANVGAEIAGISSNGSSPEDFSAESLDRLDQEVGAYAPAPQRSGLESNLGRMLSDADKLRAAGNTVDADAIEAQIRAERQRTDRQAVPRPVAAPRAAAAEGGGQGQRYRDLQAAAEVINNPNSSPADKMAAQAMLGNAGSDKPAKPQSGGRSALAQLPIQRLLGASELGIADVINVANLPIGSAGSGTIGFGKTPDGTFLGGNMQNFRNRVISSDVDDYEAMLTGISRNLAAIESGGAATGLIQLANKIEGQVTIRSTDRYYTKAIRMAQIRQIIDHGLIVSALNPNATDEQKARMNELRQQLKAAIPYTVADVQRLKEVHKQNPNATLGQLLGRNPSGRPATQQQSAPANTSGATRVRTWNPTTKKFEG